MTSGIRIFTIGHSTHSEEVFLSLLKKHQIEAVVDVRSVPYSRHNPQFDKGALKPLLKSHGISYLHLGKELGARSDDPSCYVDGRVQYDRLARASIFQEGIGRVIDGATRMRVTLMCAEKDPLDCHRTILVARELERRGCEVTHILASGEVETHTATMARLLERLGQKPDMLNSLEELCDFAYAEQEKRIAYVDEEMSKAEGTGR